MLGELVVKWFWMIVDNVWGVVPGRPKDRLPRDARRAHRRGWSKGRR